MLKVLVVDDETVVRRGIVLGVDWARKGCSPPSGTAPISS